MKRRTRHIILLAFLVAFLVTVPAVLLWTAGYRYNWRRHRLEKTGIIKLDSRPSGAYIYLSGEPFEETTPTSIFRLLPDEYEVRLEKEGYLTWQKRLEVQSGETTFTRLAVLFRDAVPRLALNGNLVKASFSPDAQATAWLRQNGELIELLLSRRRGPEPVILARFDDDKFDDLNLVWSPDANDLLLDALTQDGKRQITVFPVEATGNDLNLTASAPRRRLLPVHWSADGDFLTVRTAAGALIIDRHDQTATRELVRPELQDTLYHDQRLWFLTGGSGQAVLERAEPDNADQPETVAVLPGGHYSFAVASDRFLLLAEDDHGEGFLYDLHEHRLLGPYPASNGVWESTGRQRLLIWNDFEISVFDPETAERQLVTRVGSPIIDCAWHPYGQDLVYSLDSGLWSIEVEDIGERNSFNLARYAAGGAFRIARSGKSLQFVGTIGNVRGIYERDL